MKVVAGVWYIGVFSNSNPSRFQSKMVNSHYVQDLGICPWAWVISTSVLLLGLLFINPCTHFFELSKIESLFGRILADFTWKNLHLWFTCYSFKMQFPYSSRPELQYNCDTTLLLPPNWSFVHNCLAPIWWKFTWRAKTSWPKTSLWSRSFRLLEWCQLGGIERPKHSTRGMEILLIRRSTILFETWYHHSC